MLQQVNADWRDQGSTLPFGWIGQTATALATRGVNVEEQLLELGIGATNGRLAPQTELTPAEYLLMCVRVINIVDDEMHGTTRSQMRRGTAALGLKLLGIGKTLGSAIDSLFRFYGVAGGFCHVCLVRDEHVASIQIRADGQRCDLTAVVEEMMATHLHMIISYYLGFFLPLDRFTTTSVHHPNLGARHPYLGARIVVGDVTQVDFPASYLGLSPKRRIYDKDPVDAAMHWLSCFEPLDAQDGSLGDIGELSRGIFRSLISEDLSFEQCCAAMGIGPRHLRESLAAEGVTYRRLRKFALIERVRPYLEAEANADDMALELGYSDARSLRRALKNATGLSLSEMRLPGGRVDSLRRDGLVGNLRRELAQMS